MRQVVVRYRVKTERAEENVRLIEKVFAELAQEQPEGLRYASFKGEDGVTFIHIASIETEDGVNPLDTASAFQAFQEGIRDRCDVPPEVVQMQTIGAYQLFDS